MDISVQEADPALNDVMPHYCPTHGRLMGLRFFGHGRLGELHCPWCGIAVPLREPGHDYTRSVRPWHYEGARCPHGHPDQTCVALARTDPVVAYDLMCATIREYRAAQLAERYGCAPHIIEWVRPCPRCRSATAKNRSRLLRYELERIGDALSEDLHSAARSLRALQDDLRWLHEAFRELEAAAAEDIRDERQGFVYLIGHDRAVKIGWSDRHPATPGGRLSALQTASSEELALLGLLEGPLSLERQLQRRFRPHRLRGEWFLRNGEILDYFRENGLPV